METPVAKPSEIDIPVIRVEDWEEDPPLAVKYIKGENELELLTVYAKVKRLTHHQGRGRLVFALEAGSRSRFTAMRSCNIVYSHW